MRVPHWLAGLALATSVASSSSSSSSSSSGSASDPNPPIRPRSFDTHDYYTVQLQPDESPQLVARSLGLENNGQLGELPHHYEFSAKRGTHDADATLEALRRRRRKREVVGDGLDGVLWSRKQRLRAPWPKRIPPPPLLPVSESELHALREEGGQDQTAVFQRQQIAMDLGINDPIFNEQWHLFNTIQIGHDLNISAVWKSGVTGHNATVAIIDDGLDMYSDDLRDNYFAAGSWDFNDKTSEPRPRLSNDNHGTRCAGEIGAVKNDACGVGIAYDSKVAGIRILSGPISDEDEAKAINYGMQENQIYSCSWGPPDDGKSMDAPDLIIKKAIQYGVQKGRGGLGNIFVFASGNGAASEDNCNFDGYTNSIYSVTVGAIDRKGLHPYYSEKCSASMVVTYSSGSGDYIHTTDVGNKCSSNHGGTSAAAPIGAGLLALVLGIRPDLHWRDIQYLCLHSAVPINLDDPDGWQTTYIGKKYSHTFAYGKLDAYTLIEAAKEWKSVKPQAWFKSPWLQVNHDVPQGDQGLVSHFRVSQEMLTQANLERLEHIQVTMTVEHSCRGDLSVELISPEGLTSHLSATRKHDKSKKGYENWTFMSVVHWGEPGVGDWTIIVKDTVVDDNSGKFVNWRLSLWGEAIDADKQELYPLPTEESEKEGETDEAKVGTTSIVLPSSTTSLAGNPTDHPDRPVNQKPSASTSASTSSPVQATATPADDQTTEAVADADTEDYHLPSIFPTFGVSPRTQIWIYGAISLMLIFCVALGIYLCINRRRRRRGDSRDNYEFAMLNNKEAGDVAGAGSQRRRGGELYDAFAGESDEERFFSDDDDDDDSENADRAAYRDDVDARADLDEKRSMLAARDADAGR